ncbi:MAG: DUF192 domain-containing protein [Planctomycetota bacterium]|nr:DUF192 domain-containing protein [Planctomycetota bacterium]
MPLRLRILRTEAEQARGVIGRDVLESDEVYFFESVGDAGWFHMFGVPFDLDLAYLDADFRILVLARLRAQVDYRRTPAGTVHVAEMAAGYAARHGLAAGEMWEELRDLFRKNPG